MLFQSIVSAMLFQSIVSALNIYHKQEQIVFKFKDTGRREKFKAFRTVVKAEFSKLGKLLNDHDELFFKEFDPKIKNQVEEFIKTMETCPFPDPNLLARARRYLNHLNSTSLRLNFNRTNYGERLVQVCQDSLALVQEPPNFLKNYLANIPKDLNNCKAVLSRNFYDVGLVDLANNKTLTECVEYGKNKQKIEMNAYQDVLDNFIIAVLEARQ